MADPFTALGTTSSIISLIEAAWKLLAKTRTIYKSATGENEDNVVLSTIAADVARLGDAIILSPGCGDDLHVLVEEAQSIARDLLRVLSELKVQGKKTAWKSLKVALKDVWRSGEVEAVSQRLAKLQCQIASHVQMLILNGVSEVSHTIAQFERTDIMLGTTMQIGFRDLRKDIVTAADKLLFEDSNYNISLVSRSGNNAPDEGLVDSNLADLRDLSGKVSHLREAGRTTKDEQCVLMSLYFPGIRARRKKIPNAHAQTFEWIFQSPHPDQSRPNKFVDWLRCRSGIFWIQGKPGSGKSTLMKFLSHHHNTLVHLKHWVQEQELVVASFFFWHAGSPLQKSQEGLFRSFLFEILRRCPRLVPRVYALRLELRDDWDNDWSWTFDELLYVCRNIIAECPGTKFCIFIDGLDEYGGDHADPKDLAQNIQDIASLPNIKLCVSSRPWSVFVDAFGQDPALLLKLEDLTRSDIRRFVSDSFEGSPQFSNMRNAEPITSSLIEEVCKRAKGVFLWVHLVVRDLLDGFTNGDSLKFLNTRLERFPEDLEGFFRHMINTIPPIYLQSTARIFEIVRLALEPQLAIAFSFLVDIEDESRFAIQMPIEPMLESEIQRREDKLRRRLDARSKGLLEITSDDDYHCRYFQLRVDFIHRTVHEFLTRSDGLGPFFNQHRGNPSTSLVMCNAIVATLRRSPYQGFDNHGAIDRLFRCLFDWAEKVEQNVEESTELFSVLESAESTYHIVLSQKMVVQKPQDIKEPPNTRFLGLACEYNNIAYTKARLGDNRIRAVINKPDRPLLDYALNKDQGNVHPGLIETLLDNGADPNQTYRGSTVWARFVWRIDHKLIRLVKPTPLMEETDCRGDKDIKTLIKLLVDHGADLDSPINERRSTYFGNKEHTAALNIARRNCLHGEEAWEAYHPHNPRQGENVMLCSDVIRDRFTEDEYSALLFKRTHGRFGNWYRRRREMKTANPYQARREINTFNAYQVRRR